MATVNALKRLGVNLDHKDTLMPDLRRITGSPKGTWHYPKTPEATLRITEELRYMSFIVKAGVSIHTQQMTSALLLDASPPEHPDQDKPISGDTTPPLQRVQAYAKLAEGATNCLANHTKGWMQAVKKRFGASH